MMIIPDDIYRYTKVQPLSASDPTLGTVQNTYEVRQVSDVRNLALVRSYRVTCTQRVIIPNANSFVLTPGAVTGYLYYPALLSSTFTLSSPSSNQIRLVTYSPRTLNTTVSTSRSGSDGTNKSTSRQHTTGSSTSETNTYGANASFGFFGEDLTGSFGMDWSHSQTDEKNQSTSRGSDHGSSHETGSSESMSVKDWASYAFLTSPDSTVPTWVWGQEYPWDTIQYRDCPAGDSTVQVPDFVLDRLFDSATTPTQVYPPSQLSLFGVDFTMKAAWLLDLPPTIAEQAAITVHHQIGYATGSHRITGATPPVEVKFDPAPGGVPEIKSDPLDLTLLGLDPVHGPGSAGGAVIGFVPGKFIVPPVDAKDMFKIISEENTLQVTGVGFDDVMTTQWSAGKNIKLWVQFKIVDADYDYSLYFKHWKTSHSNGWAMELVFNGDIANPIYRHIDTDEGEGGDDNLSVVNLRNKDYTSVDYHDYLVMGLNTIEITLSPNGAQAGYVLRALAIGGR